MNRASISSGYLACLALLLGSTPAAAEVSSAQRATAEALFQQAAQLMDEKRFSEACEKFAASQELDAGLGTMLYLADCYEQAGRTASAWALFREAEDASRRADQPDRARIASERAGNLEARLSKLELRVADVHRPAGLELRINDALVPSASWNGALPVDPGATRIEARAPGKKSWTVQIKIEAGPASEVVTVPELADAPKAVRANDSAAVAHGSAQPATGSAQRVVGYVMGAAGIVALSVGGYFGYRAYSLNKQSKGDCRALDPNACTPAGASERSDAKAAGALSTVATVSGGALLVGGVTLIFTAPSGHATRAGSVNPSQASSPIFGLQLRGVW